MTPVAKRRAWLIALLLLWVALWFAGAQSRSLLEPDEGRYAEVAREMLASGDWVTPRFDGVLFFDKPPLQYWGTALAYASFGLHAWTARLWGLLLGLLAVALTGWCAARTFGRVAGWAAAAVLGSSLLWVIGTHLATLDAGVAALLGMTLCSFILAQLPDTTAIAQRRWMLLTWVLMAAAVLSKGLIGIVFPAGALFFYLLWTRQWSLLRRLHWWPGLPLLLALALPWFIAVQLRHPQFFGDFFIRQQFTRYLTDHYSRAQPWWFFLPVLVIGLFPWLALLPAALKPPSPHEGFDARRLAWIWLWMILVFFSISHSKLPLYLLPVFPAAALLLGDVIARSTARALAVALGIAAALLAPAALVALHARVPADLHALAPAFGGYMQLLALALLAGALLLAASAWLAWRGRRLAALALAACTALAVLQTALIGFQALAPAYSAQPLARAMRPWLHPDTPVYMVDALQRGLPFYLRRTVTLVGAPPYDLTGGLHWQPGLLLSLADFEQRWRAQPQALAVLAPRLLPQLRAQGLPLQVLACAPRWVLVRRPQRPTGVDNRRSATAVCAACPLDTKSAVPPSTATACSPASPSPLASASSTIAAR